LVEGRLAPSLLEDLVLRLGLKAAHENGSLDYKLAFLNFYEFDVIELKAFLKKRKQQNKGSSRRVKPPELKQFLANSADGAKTKRQLKTEAEANFEGEIITTRAFGEAWAELPAHQRRQRGDTDKTLSRRAKSEG
jgi:hypothetical protein